MTSQSLAIPFLVVLVPVAFVLGFRQGWRESAVVWAKRFRLVADDMYRVQSSMPVDAVGWFLTDIVYPRMTYWVKADVKTVRRTPLLAEQVGQPRDNGKR